MIQDVAIRIDLGYQRFFENIEDRRLGKTKRKVGKPKIKPNHKYKSVSFTQSGYKIEGNRLRINSLKKSFHILATPRLDWQDKESDNQA